MREGDPRLASGDRVWQAHIFEDRMVLWGSPVLENANSLASERRGEMARKILVAVDESKSSMNAVKYVARAMEKTGTVTLFSVLPDPTAACGLDSPSLTPSFKANRQAFCAIEDTKKEIVKRFMDEAKGVLVKAGFPPKSVTTKILKKKSGIARDILKEAQRGKYTTLVIGRRGLSGVKQFVLGSVSNKVVSLAKNVSVIVVD
jgi:nucleotide-binding universal stress UspA family protein